MRCAVFLLTIVEVYVEAQLTLTPCVEDSVNGKNERVAVVRRGQTSLFLCRGLAAGDTVQWRYLFGEEITSSAGTCAPLTSPGGSFAGSAGPGFILTRPSNSESVMIVDPGVAGAEDRVKTGSLGCRRDSDSTVNNFCLMDLIDPAVGTCSVKFERQNADDWVATGFCTITAYSSRGRYKCNWYRTKDSSGAELQSTVSYPGPSGVCRFTQLLPAAGRYSYRVRITPGDVSTQATFNGSNEISTPTAPTVSGCSSDSYIEENSPVSCTCRTTGLGQPAGRLVWRRVGAASPVKYGDYGNDRLDVSQMLTRDDHEATQFGCGVDWNKTEVSGSPLTFKVGYKPEGLTFSLNSRPEVTVAENATVTMTCLADSRPVATMTVHKEGVTSPVSSGSSPLTLTLDPARCADTGTYVCSGSNQFGQPDSPVSGKVYVTLETPPIAGQGSEGRGGADTVTVALAVVLAVVVIALIVTTALVVWFYRRLRQANMGTPEPGNTKEMTVSHVGLRQEFEAATGHYDSLDMSDVGVRSGYSDIGSHANSAGPYDSPHLPDVGVASDYTNVRSHGNNSAGPNATAVFESPYEIPG